MPYATHQATRCCSMWSKLPPAKRMCISTAHDHSQLPGTLFMSSSIVRRRPASPPVGLVSVARPMSSRVDDDYCSLGILRMIQGSQSCRPSQPGS